MPCMAATIGSIFLVIEASSKRTEAPLITTFCSCGDRAAKSMLLAGDLVLQHLRIGRDRQVVDGSAEAERADVAAASDRLKL